jgi:DNA-binding NarL/FixJ family response regulator
MVISAAPSLPKERRIVIIDDHVAIIEMLKQVIDSVSGYRVVGQAEDANAGLALCAKERPDLIILDLVLPPASGLNLIGKIRAACADARILIFSGYLQPAMIRRALAAGAHGLVEKVAPLDEFRQALSAVAEGRIYFSRAASEKVRHLVSRAQNRPMPLVPLSEREKAILRAIATGLSSKEISTRLGLSVHTIINERSKLVRKTGLKGVAQLSRYAAEMGLVDPTAGPMEI